MTRSYLTNAEPNRDLIRLERDVQRGDDVRALEAATGRRLSARNVATGRIGHDGILTADEFDAMVTAGRLLGAREDTLTRTDAHGRRVLPVGVQRMIRYPGRRTDAQLQRAEDRMAELLKAQAASARPSPGHLNADQRSEARTRAVAAMRLALHHAPAVHYTQGGRRWDGIRLGLRAAGGHFPNYADCSSMTTWALWNALTGVGGAAFPDVVNGASWTAGYTGTLLAHGTRVAWASMQPGDLVIYGRGFPGEHVAMYVGGGQVISHGSEAGPFMLPWRYRGDVMAARRYIA